MFGTILSGFEIALVALIIYVVVYTIICRICECFERCATARAIGKLHEAGVMINPEDMEKYIDERTKKKNS